MPGMTLARKKLGKPSLTLGVFSRPQLKVYQESLRFDEEASICYKMAEGIRGYAFLRQNEAEKMENEIYIPLIFSSPERKGHLSRFLDNLPKHWTVHFPVVLNPILEGALQRRGYTMHWHEESWCYGRRIK